MLAIVMLMNLAAVVWLHASLAQHEQPVALVLCFLLIQEVVNLGATCIARLPWNHPLPHLATAGTLVVILIPGYSWLPFVVAAIYFLDLAWFSLWLGNQSTPGDSAAAKPGKPTTT